MALHRVTCIGTDDGWFAECDAGDLLAYAATEAEIDQAVFDHVGVIPTETEESE